jgi:uncharacterized protein (TIGR01777 family)
MLSERTVIVTGATGTIGQALCKRLLAQNYRLIVLSRNPQKARMLVEGAEQYIFWEPTADSAGTPWRDALDGVYAVIHLAAAPALGKRWTPAYKRVLYHSWAIGTRGIVHALSTARQKPQVFVCASSVGYYGYRTRNASSIYDDYAAPGNDLIAHLYKAREYEAVQATLVGIRTVMIRTGFLLAKTGELPRLVAATKHFAGGPILPGTQYRPWIHIDDEVEIIMMALENTRVRGAINAVAPEPTTEAQFMRTLRAILNQPFGLPSWSGILPILFGESADIVTRGRSVIPRKLYELGYQFFYPSLTEALQDLLEIE